ncbi:MAG: zf-HC2 domain-containing protein [Polyangiales bacterium]
MSCRQSSSAAARQAARAIEPYVDGELDASDQVHVECHLDSCPTCSEHVALGRAIKRDVRATTREHEAPASLRARLAISVEALEASRERVRRPSWQSAVPWAAAAAVAIAVGGGVRAFGDREAGPQTRSDVGADHASPIVAAAAQSLVLDEFAGYHARPLPPEELDPIRVNSVFSPIVGVPVRPVGFAAALMEEQPTTFSGGRLMRVHSEPAATLFYDVGGNRVTVFVFDPQRIHLHSACCLAPRVIRSHGGIEKMILVGRAKGYPLAAFERDGIGYAVSADMSEHDVMQIASNL